ncbi:MULTISPECIES: hypothetical protein [Paenibacillus]|uniref:hypothetical protein n=1 Tax=Paenibacillus TaxID=44249 RepID=UPI0022B85903|nr:hypothetical protein [Paenibacillus caseinilyticus]MCZ8520115.1 hypothetical protein [Paenibacillus caseinilyticus]
MIAIVYRKIDGYVLDVVKDVTSVADGNVIGQDHQLKGIDMQAAGVIVVDDAVEVKAGNRVDPTKLDDLSEQLPKSAEQLRDQRLADLEKGLADYFANGGA